MKSFRFDRQFINRISQKCFIEAAVDTGGGGGGGTGTGAGAGAGAGAGTGGAPAISSGGGGTGVPSAQSGAQGGSPSSGQQGDGKGAQVLDWANAPAEFRKAFDELKTKYEPWGKLADTYKVDHDVVGTQVQSFQGLINEAYDLGEKTGYTAEQIERSLQKNLVGTLHFLRQAATKAAGPGGQGQGGKGTGGEGQGADNLEQKMQKAIQDAVKPYQDDLTKRQADAASTLFDTTCTELMSKAYGKDEMSTLPSAFKNLLLDATSELMKYDEATGKALLQGKTAGLQKHFNDAKTIIEGAFIEWQKWQTGRASGSQQGSGGAQGQGNGQGGQGKGNVGYKGNFLDDLAQGDDSAFAELRRRRS